MHRLEKGHGIIFRVAQIEELIRSVGGLNTKQYKNEEQGARYVILY